MATRGEERLFGLYRDFSSLRLGVDSLKALRFGNSDISVLFPEAAVSKTLPEAENDSEPAAAQAPAFIGGSLGWLTYVRPERTGIIADALVALGVSPSKASLYEDHLRSGCLLLSIRLTSQAQFDNVTSALTATGAEAVVAGCAGARPAPSRAVPVEKHPGDQFVQTLFAS